MENEENKESATEQTLAGAFEIEIIEDDMELLDHPIIGNN